LKVNKNIVNTDNNNTKKLEKKSRSEKRRSVISHVGRAARKLRHELDAEADDHENDVSEHREKIMGALALMELAGSAAPIDVGSEVSIDGNENDDQIETTYWQQL
jgi:hypothetical protein